LDLGKLSEAAAYFRKVADQLAKEGDINPKVLRVDTNTLLYQVPGGMLSNLLSQLKQAHQEDKYDAVLKEVPKVRKDFGYPPLVTPSSQIVGTQAVMNVLTGRYKMFPKESKALLRGEYGRLPGEVNAEVRKMAIGDASVIDHRPADDIPPEMDKLREETKGMAKSEEDVLSYALFPQVAPQFFKERDGQKEVPKEKVKKPAGLSASNPGERVLIVEDLTA
ncbi:MAG: oxaloacetate decarboxylase subunit alpha, partial [Eubacteriaceae bacterium]|nr:oxaloacetate decarboxylase subunit alpha [Eubacteriaceae bacterium]